jgi:EPS-associated MarR family transcriptional regulator
MKNDQDHLNLLRKIGDKPKSSQRELADELGFSLGKLNYCLKELKAKGLIKMNNFKKSKDKIKYIYVLTPGGIAAKTKLTINFMKRKIQEYDQLKKELKRAKN